MIQIKHYIVTYNNNEILNDALNSIVKYKKIFNFSFNYQIIVINNHSNITIHPSIKNKISVIDNQARPDFSTGHLSRNWNQAIINGFGKINNPECDILITSQNDCFFEDDFLEKIINLHKKYSFIQFGAGDNFVSYTIDSIKNVGLWDERFCNIGHQEADYFLRQLLYNTNGSTINDNFHKRIHNSVPNLVTLETQTGFQRNDVHHIASMQHHQLSRNVFMKKWGFDPVNLEYDTWNYDILKDKKELIDSYIYYPYFEKDVLTLNQQKYIL